MNQSEKAILTSMPEDLFDFAVTQLSDMSPGTQTKYRRKWNNLLSQQVDPCLRNRVNNVVHLTVNRYLSKHITYATFKAYRTIISFGLSILIAPE